MNTTNKRFVLFDFDGVIADSFALCFKINKMVCPDITESDYKKRFEGNINDWDRVANGHTKNCRHDIDFFSEYIPKMKEQVGVVNGMVRVVKELSEKYVLIIISSTITNPIKEFMEKYKLSSYFIEILGNDIHASKIEKIKIVLSKYNFKPTDSIFVTDTLGDMKEATHAGIGTIAVTWGFHEQGTLLKGNPFRVIEKPKDLPAAVSDYFNRQMI